MTLRERCEKFYEKNKLVGIIEKFKAAFYSYDWEKLDSKYIIKYQKDNDGKDDHVVLRTKFLREIANLANISSDFEMKLDFLNELVKQKMIDSYKHFVDSDLDRVVISIDKYEANKKYYILFGTVTESESERVFDDFQDFDKEEYYDFT